MGIGMLLALRMRPDAQFTTPGLTAPQQLDAYLSSKAQ
jgi:hypothetical protein